MQRCWDTSGDTSTSKQIENVQTKFCKRIIGFSSSSSNVTALGECGTLSLCCIYYVKCIKYWLKILNMDNRRYVKQCYYMLKGLDDVNRETWATKIRVFLFSYGFGTVWMQQGVGDTDLFISILTQE